jgi:hypothetical protein
LKVRVTKKVDENQPPELDKHQQASSEGAAP